MGEKQNGNRKTSLISTILQAIPSEAEITRVEYEGPRIALHTKNPVFLHRNSYLVSDLVNNVKKRVVIRTDRSVLKGEDEAREIIKNLIPPEIELKNLFFDGALCEVIAEVENPHLLGRNAPFDAVAVVEKTGWKLKVRKAPHIQSSSLQTVYYSWKSNEEERANFLREVGERIFRLKISKNPEVSLYTLGAFKEVGRSSILVTTPESKILLDCGIHPGAKETRDSYPRLDWADVSLEELDAVIISHAHMDHQAFLPVLLKYGYDGPIYCSEPTLPLMTLLQMDFIKIASMEGGQQLYDVRDIREEIKRSITLPYGIVTDVSPDVKLVLNNAGHILGSSTVHLHIGEGAHNIVYTGDYKFSPTMLLDATSWNFPRVETLITESTYGAKEDIMLSRFEAEANFVNLINTTLKEGGKVLIPVPAVGRAQEIMLVLDQYMKEQKLLEVPVFLEGMISEATAIHVAYPEYLARELSARIMGNGENPFLSSYFTVIEHPSNREEALRDGPGVIMATSGMMEGGPVIEYLRVLAQSEKNRIIFVSYQVSGTLGRRIVDGAQQISLPEDGGKLSIVDIKCKVDRVEGFSGHSDYNQIIKYVGRLRPKLKQVIANHGERRKVENLAYAISRIFRLPAYSPNVQEAIKLY